MTASVLVINVDKGPLHHVSLHKALRMLWRQVAVVHEAEPGVRIGPYEMPRVLRLITYVYPKWRYTKGPVWSRRAVLARDGHRCGYCQAWADTIDHILPTSRGGQNSWDNTVACCHACNQHKGDRTPAAAGMRLVVTPAVPTWASMIRR